MHNVFVNFSVIEADDFTKKLFMIFKEVLLAENKAVSVIHASITFLILYHFI